MINNQQLACSACTKSSSCIGTYNVHLVEQVTRVYMLYVKCDWAVMHVMLQGLGHDCEEI